MKENKTKGFTNFIKQDFDIVKDYKNASKDLTAKEALDKLYKLELIDQEGNFYNVNEYHNSEEIVIISKALDKLETLEKRDTPMKDKILKLVNDYTFCNNGVGLSLSTRQSEEIRANLLNLLDRGGE
jgi:hypothetical protein